MLDHVVRADGRDPDDAIADAIVSIVRKFRNVEKLVEVYVASLKMQQHITQRMFHEEGLMIERFTPFLPFDGIANFYCPRIQEFGRPWLRKTGLAFCFTILMWGVARCFRYCRLRGFSTYQIGFETA